MLKDTDDPDLHHKICLDHLNTPQSAGPHAVKDRCVSTEYYCKLQAVEHGKRLRAALPPLDEAHKEAIKLISTKMEIRFGKVFTWFRLLDSSHLI